MSQNSYIKCLECGTINTETDYCEECGSIINIVLKRQLESRKKIELREETLKVKTQSGIDKFFTGLSEHPNVAVRRLSQMIYAIWAFLGMVIGGIIAAVIGIAAG